MHSCFLSIIEVYWIVQKSAQIISISSINFHEENISMLPPTGSRNRTLIALRSPTHGIIQPPSTPLSQWGNRKHLPNSRAIITSLKNLYGKNHRVCRLVPDFFCSALYSGDSSACFCKAIFGSFKISFLFKRLYFLEQVYIFRKTEKIVQRVPIYLTPVSPLLHWYDKFAPINEPILKHY